MLLSRRQLFFGFLAFGLVTGLFVGNLGKAIAAPLSRANQENTLIVLVDDLGSEQPALEGIWLAARSQGSDAINWEPIYPLLLTEANEEYAQPHSAIYLSETDFADPVALSPLRSQGAWWNEAFWLDEAALGVLQSLGGQTEVTLFDAWLQPQGALYQQVQILNSLCSGQPNDPALDQILALIPNHIRSSISPFDLITRWDSWSQASFPLSCNHPWAD